MYSIQHDYHETAVNFLTDWIKHQKLLESELTYAEHQEAVKNRPPLKKREIHE